MAITSALVLFAVIWFMLLLMALPMRVKSQEQDGEVVPGTPASAPVDPMIGKKMFWGYRGYIRVVGAAGGVYCVWHCFDTRY